MTNDPNFRSVDRHEDSQFRNANKKTINQPVSQEILVSQLAAWIEYLAVDVGVSRKTHETYSKEVKRFVS